MHTHNPPPCEGTIVSDPHRVLVMCRVTTGHVALDLSNATATPGIFTENAMVVVEGEVVNGLFRVVTIGFPPPEPRCT